MNSMTGFGRATGEAQQWRWAWEIRSVNGRGLDIRIRVPSSFESLDPVIRKLINASLKRGSVSVSLNATRQSGASRVVINDDVLQGLLSAAKTLQEHDGVNPPSADGLLALKGVLEQVEDDETEDVQKLVQRELTISFEHALQELLVARQAEGRRLEDILLEKIDQIEVLTNKIKNSKHRTPDAIKARIQEQVNRLLEQSSAFDEVRLHQEAILIATRADVEEELQRLAAHILAARELTQSDGAVGRQFDFLAQEFNREANTLCSKAGSDDISQAGLALKTVIDQVREQVQNIE